jgi:hypothetical protein
VEEEDWLSVAENFVVDNLIIDENDTHAGGFMPMNVAGGSGRARPSQKPKLRYVN